MGLPLADLTHLEPGAHLCRFYDDERDLGRGAAAFVANGLAAGQRVLYVASARRPGQVEASLQVHGVGAERALAAGQLVIRDFDEVYGTAPRPLQEMEDDFRALNVQARADGAAGLRVAAEMGDAADLFGSLTQLLRWEERATRLQREVGVSTVCQYDRRRLSPDEAALVASEHTALAPDDAPPPLAGFYPDGRGLRIMGELDISNVDELMRAVEARLTLDPRLELDLAELSFVDIGTLGTLFQLVHRRPEVELTLRNVSPQVLRTLSLAGLSHPRVVLA